MWTLNCMPLLNGRKELKNFTARLDRTDRRWKRFVLPNNDTEELIIDKDKMSQMRLHFSF